MTSSYGEIVERLESLTGPSYALEVDIGHAVGYPVELLQPPPNWTYSTDAALSLIEKLIPTASPGISKNVHHGHWCAWLARAADRVHPDDTFTTEMFSEGTSDANAAIALLIALFKAMEIKQ